MLLAMLHELKAKTCTYSAGDRTARIDIGSGGRSPKDEPGTVLLDANGGVVGVDVTPDAPTRAVVLVGRHEDVVETKPVRVAVSRDGRGQIASVVIHGIDAP